MGPFRPVAPVRLPPEGLEIACLFRCRRQQRNQADDSLGGLQLCQTKHIESVDDPFPLYVTPLGPESQEDLAPLLRRRSSNAQSRHHQARETRMAPPRKKSRLAARRAQSRAPARKGGGTSPCLTISTTTSPSTSANCSSPHVRLRFQRAGVHPQNGRSIYLWRFFAVCVSEQRPRNDHPHSTRLC